MPGRQQCWSTTHFKDVTKDDKPGAECVHCGETLFCTSGTRKRCHLGRCEKAPADIVKRATDNAVTGQKRTLSAQAPSTSEAKQQRLETFPAIKDRERDAIEKAVGRFVFASGHPFSTVEDPLFLQILRAVRPNVRDSDLPSRHALSTRVLNAVYEDVSKDEREKLRTAKQIVIQCDTWQNARKEKVFAVIAAPAGCAKGHMLKAGLLTAKNHTAAELHTHLKDCNDELLQKTICIVTDGDSTAVSSAKKLAAQHPGIKTLVCGPHTIARCVNDCVGTRRSKGKETSNEFHHVANLVTTLVATIRNVEYLAKLFEEKSTQQRKLVLPAVTRWTTMSETWRQVAGAREALLLMREDIQANTLCPGIKALLEPPMWAQFVALEPFMNAVQRAVSLLQADNARAAYIIPALKHVESACAESARKMPTASSKQKMQTVQNKIRARTQKYQEHEGGWVSAATALSPRLASNIVQATDDVAEASPLRILTEYELDSETRKMAKQYLKTLGGIAATAELLQFSSGTGIYEEDKDELGHLALVKPPEQWWKVIAGTRKSHLASIAEVVSSVTASSAQVERAFSSMQWLSQGRRNRLLASKVHQMCVVHNSLRPAVPPENCWWDEERLAAEAKAAATKASPIDVDKEENPNMTADEASDEASDCSWD